MCHLEKQLARDSLMLQLYRRYVDDTLARIPNTDAATEFLTSLIGLHPSLSFTMEFPENAMIPFIAIEIIENGTKIETQVYRKATNTGLLLYFKSHTDKRYKVDLLKTMLHRAYALSSETDWLLMQNVTTYALFLNVSVTLEPILNQSFPNFLFDTFQVLQRT